MRYAVTSAGREIGSQLFSEDMHAKQGFCVRVVRQREQSNIK